MTGLGTPGEGAASIGPRRPYFPRMVETGEATALTPPLLIMLARNLTTSLKDIPRQV
jgi:hypothetical protein